jgi:orotidine-5'-phosphate decarboxylase
MSQGASFGARLNDAILERGALCVGIDPHAYLLSEWGLPDSASGVEQFGLRVVDATAGRIAVVKPQVAFFERHGSAGYAALERVIRAAREAGLLVIADVKRGDLGSSVEAYGQAWLQPGSPLEVDAMTVSAFQGLGSLDAPLRLAAEHGKGLFVLAATSNPEAAAIQQAVLASSRHSAARTMTVARAIIEDVTAFNQTQPTASFASVGVVLGATLDLAEFGIDTSTPAASNILPVLAPGFGHQGAQLADAARIYGALAAGLIVSESRAVLSAGPDGLADAIGKRAAEVRSTLG